MRVRNANSHDLIDNWSLLSINSNHLAIALFLDHIGGAFAFVLPIGHGVDERTLDY